MNNKIKIIILLVLTISLLMPVFSFVVLAETVENVQKAENDITDSDDVVFVCNFDAASNSINFSGTVSHEALIKYRYYTVEIYCVPFEKSADEVVFDNETAPIAETDISVRFEFSKKITSLIEKYYSYCVALCSTDGERILATTARKAQIESSLVYNSDQRTSYKGIESDMIVSATNAYSERVIIPVFIDRLISNVSSGYVYLAGGANIFFDKTYIDSLDAKIRTATASGSQVYVRLLLTGENNEIALNDPSDRTEKYYMPDIYDEKVIVRTEAAISFISERYSELQSGKINGIIIGSEADKLCMSYVNAENFNADFNKYIRMYALYTVVVANSARRVRSDIDIVIPVSNDNVYVEALLGNDSSNDLIFLDEIINLFENAFVSGLNFTVLVEGDTLPFDISEDGNLIFNEDGNLLHSGNIYIFEEYLKSLKQERNGVPQNFMYMLNVPQETRANTLAAVYAYSYFKSYKCNLLSSFCISLASADDALESDMLSELLNVYKYINTEKREEVLKNILSVFSAQSWDEVLGAECPEITDYKKIYSIPTISDIPSDVIGSFKYFDFSSSFDLNEWYCGSYSKNIKIDRSTGEEALSADMDISQNGEYSEILCLYEYSEVFSYTPYLSFNVEIGTEKNDGELFEVKISGIYGDNIIETSQTVLAGEKNNIILELSSYAEGLIDSWKISIRSLDGKSETINLKLYDIIGYSTEYDSDMLASKIDEFRADIRNQSQSDEEKNTKSTVIMIATVAVLIIALGIGIVICFRQSENSESANE